MNTNNPFFFLIDIAFDIYTAILLLRFLLQYVGADFYNPISQFIVKASNPVVTPVYTLLAMFAPAPKRSNGSGDKVHRIHTTQPRKQLLSIGTVSLLLAWVLIVIKLLVVTALVGIAWSIAAVLLTSAHDLVSLTIDVFIFAIFIQAILSWVNRDPYNPVAALLGSLTAPVLGPVRRVIKPIGGLDLSPIVALIGLMFLKRLVSYLFQML